MLDLHMPESQNQLMKCREHLDHTKIVAMTFGIDGAAKELAEDMGATALIDKADLTTELILVLVGLRQTPSEIPRHF
jgi:hypothetical protein